MKKYLLSASIAMPFLVACNPELSDLQAFVEGVKQNTQVSIEPYPEFTKVPAFKYQGNADRSPFDLPKQKGQAIVQTVKQNCLQPDYKRQKHPLERYGTDALSIKGFFQKQGQIWALIQANDGTLHKARKGDRLGLYFGRIESIAEGEVKIIEMLPDGTGCWRKKQAILSMAAQAGEKNNV